MINLEKLLEGKEPSDEFYRALGNVFCSLPGIMECKDCVGIKKCKECDKKSCLNRCSCDLILGKWLLEEVKDEKN